MWIESGLYSVAVGVLIIGIKASWALKRRVMIGCLGLIWWPAAWVYWGLWVLCDFLLSRLAALGQRRRDEKAFKAYWPWLVDLMRIAIGGGAAHGLAFDHAVTALKDSPLAHFGSQVFARRREGQDRIAAIVSVASELKSKEALELGLAMRESARQGSDLSPLLVEQARALRERTTRRLEKAANGLSVKLLIPLMFCFFPMFFIVLAFTILHSLGRLPWSH